MSAPNLINITSIIGKTSSQAVTTATSTLLANATGSNTVIKINSLYIANISSMTDAETTINFVRENTSTAIAKDSLVPLGNTLIAIAKDASLYLEEGDELQISASSNGVLTSVISYEIIS